MERIAARAQGDLAEVLAHPWEAIKRGWVLTEDEKPGVGVEVVRPLPASPHLEIACREWMDNPTGMIAKSRQMQMTWLFCWLNLWRAITKDGSLCVFQGKREEDVLAHGTKGLMGRARFIRKNLPRYFQPLVTGEAGGYETYANGSTMEAIPEGKDIIRSRAVSSLVMDEMAFQPTSESNWNAAVPAAQGGGRIWGVTTPNGHEFLYRQADPGRSWDRWRQWPELIPGAYAYTNARGIRLIALHYTADPTKRTLEWQAAARKSYTNAHDYAREMELDFSLYEGLGVYANEFNRARHVIEQYVPDATQPLYRGWDTGYNGQAVSWWQFNSIGQFVWFDQILAKRVPLPNVVQEAHRRTTAYLAPATAMDLGMDGQWANRRGRVEDFGDPAMRSHNSQGETDVAVLSRFGITLRSRPTTNRKADLVENIRQLLLPRSDGKPGMLIAMNSPEMEHVVAGFGGGYHYGKAPEGKSEKELPEKDGFYDHIFDCGQYVVDNLSPIQYAAPSDEADPEWWKDRDSGVGLDSVITPYHGPS